MCICRGFPDESSDKGYVCTTFIFSKPGGKEEEETSKNPEWDILSLTSGTRKRVLKYFFLFPVCEIDL